jgi:glycosyltransferase involved in cell wall biosynthesis
MNVSVLILTYNEEASLPRCLDSVSWSDDIVVFDSCSTDRTVEIAKARGVRVVNRKFDNYSNQRNAAFKNVSYKHPWVLMLDADEIPTGELLAEIQEKLAHKQSADVAMFRVRRKDMFMGRWLKHSSGYPTWFPRLLRPGKVIVSRAVNEEYIADGLEGILNGHLEHYPFNKGISYWFDRHNRYSTMEAEIMYRARIEPLRWSGLWCRDPVKRRRAQKEFAYKIPCRPMIMFIALYFIRRGFLDGYPGYVFCTLRATYERMIDFKINEAQRRGRGLPI